MARINFKLADGFKEARSNDLLFADLTRLDNQLTADDTSALETTHGKFFTNAGDVLNESGDADGDTDPVSVDTLSEKERKKAERLLRQSYLTYKDEYYRADNPVVLKLKYKFAVKYWSYYASYLCTDWGLGKKEEDGKITPFPASEISLLNEGNTDYIVITLEGRAGRNKSITTEKTATTETVPAGQVKTDDPFAVTVKVINADAVAEDDIAATETVTENPVYYDHISGKLVVEAASNTEAFGVIGKRKLLPKNQDAPFIWREREADGKIVDHPRLYNLAPPDQWFNRNITYSAVTVKNLLEVAGLSWKSTADAVNEKKSFFNAEFANLVRAAQKILYPDQESKINGKYDGWTQTAVTTFLEKRDARIKKEKADKAAHDKLLFETGEPNTALNKRTTDDFYNYYRHNRKLIINRPYLHALQDAIADNDRSLMLQWANQPALNMADYGFMLTHSERVKLLTQYGESMYLYIEEERVVCQLLENVPPDAKAKLVTSLDAENKKLYNNLKALCENYETRPRFYKAVEAISGKVDPDAMKTYRQAISENWGSLDGYSGEMSPTQMQAFTWKERKQLMDNLIDDSYWTDFDGQQFVEVIWNTPKKDYSSLRPLVLPQAGESDKFYNSFIDRLSRTAKDQLYQHLETMFPGYVNVQKLNKVTSELAEGNEYLTTNDNPVNALNELTAKELQALDKYERYSLLSSALLGRLWGMTDEDMKSVIRLLNNVPDEPGKAWIRENLVYSTGAANTLNLLYSEFDDTNMPELKKSLRKLFEGSNELIEKVRALIRSKDPYLECTAYLLDEDMLKAFTGYELAQLVRSITNGSYTDGWNEELIISIFHAAGSVTDKPVQQKNESNADFEKRQAEYNTSESRRKSFKAELEKDNNKLWNEVQGDIQGFNDSLIRLEYQSLDTSPAGVLLRKISLETYYNSGNYLLFYVTLATFPTREMKSFTKENRVKYLKRISLLQASTIEKWSYAVDDVSENAIVRMLDSTPEADVPYVLDALYANGGALFNQLEYRIDFSDYTIFHNTVEKLQDIRAYSLQNKNVSATTTADQSKKEDTDNPVYRTPEELKFDQMVDEALAAEELKSEYAQAGAAVKNVLPYSNPGIVKSIWEGKTSRTITASLTKVSVPSKTNPGKMEERTQVVAVCYYGSVPVRTETFDPEEIVALQYYDEADEQMPGRMEFMHATKLLYIYNEQTNQAINEVVDLVALALAFIPGGQVLSLAAKLIQGAIVIADIIFTVADLITISYRKELEATQEGRAFLSFYDTLGKIMLVAAGPMILTSPAILARARKVINGLGERYASLKTKLVELLGLESDEVLERGINAAKKEDNLATLGKTIDDVGGNVRTRQLFDGTADANKVQVNKPANPAGKKMPAPHPQNPNIKLNYFDEAGVEFLEDQGKYYKRTAPDQPLTPISKNEYRIALGEAPVRPVSEFLEEIDQSLANAAANSNNQAVATWEQMKAVWEKIKKEFGRDFVLEAEELAASEMPGGMAVWRVRADGSIETIPVMFTYFFQSSDKFQDYAKRFVNIGRQLKLFGSSQINMIELLTELLKLGFKLGFFQGKTRFLNMIRLTFKIPDTVIGNAALDELYDNVLKGMGKIRRVGSSYTRDEIYAAIDYELMRPYTGKSLDEIIEEIRGGKVWDDVNKTFRAASDKPVTFSASPQALTAPIPDPAWQNQMNKLAMRRQLMREEAADLAEQYGKESSQYKAKMEQLRNVSEDAGEMAADQFVVQHFTSRSKKVKQQLFPPPGAGPEFKQTHGMFDRIYELEDGTLIFVEAKGGGSPKGAKNIDNVDSYKGEYAEQGSWPYLLETAQDMENSGLMPKGFREKIELLERRGKIEYYQVRQDFTKTGAAKSMEVEQFKLEKKKTK